MVVSQYPWTSWRNSWPFMYQAISQSSLHALPARRKCRRCLTLALRNPPPGIDVESYSSCAPGCTSLGSYKSYVQVEIQRRDVFDYRAATASWQSKSSARTVVPCSSITSMLKLPLMNSHKTGKMPRVSIELFPKHSRRKAESFLAPLNTATAAQSSS